MEFLRAALGLIGIASAYLFGRAIATARKRSQVYSWGLRAAACMVALGLRHAIDATSIIGWSLSAVALAFGYWNGSKPRQDEDLSHTIFPDKE